MKDKNGHTHETMSIRGKCYGDLHVPTHLSIPSLLCGIFAANFASVPFRVCIILELHGNVGCFKKTEKPELFYHKSSK